MGMSEERLLRRVRVLIDEKTGEVVEVENERKEEEASDTKRPELYTGQYL